MFLHPGCHIVLRLRQNGVQAVHLLIAQGGELAQMLPPDGKEGVGVRVKLFQVVRDMHQRHHGEHHPLLPFGEVGQKFLGTTPERPYDLFPAKKGRIKALIKALYDKAARICISFISKAAH